MLTWKGGLEMKLDGRHYFSRIGYGRKHHIFEDGKRFSLCGSSNSLFLYGKPPGLYEIHEDMVCKNCLREWRKEHEDTTRMDH